MSKFSTKRINQQNLPESDTGTTVQELLQLTQGSPFREAIHEVLEINTIGQDPIEIPGAATLVAAVDAESQKFLKFDIRSNFEDLKFTYLHDENAIEFSFTNWVKIDFPNEVSEEIKAALQGVEQIDATPIYSAQTSLFDKLFNFDKYANGLIKKGFSGVVLANLEMLERIYREQGTELPAHVHRYRMLRDEEDGKYYFRALISADRYKDYNIGVSVFIALVALHQIMKETGDRYAVKYFEYTESFINAQFENTIEKEIPGLGTVRFVVELSNSETTRGAVKLTGLCSVVSTEGESRAEVSIRNKFQSPILSISHGHGPTTAVGRMAVRDQLKMVQDEMFEDLSAINASREPGYLLQVFRSKIKNGRTLDPNRKKQLTQMLEQTVNNFHQLLVMMDRAETLVEEDDVDAKEYLRYVMYTVLKDGK